MTGDRPIPNKKPKVIKIVPPLKPKAMYSIKELALAGRVGKVKLTNLFKSAGINILEYNGRKFVCLTELEDKVPQLFDSIRATTIICADD